MAFFRSSSGVYPNPRLFQLEFHVRPDHLRGQPGAHHRPRGGPRPSSRHRTGLSSCSAPLRSPGRPPGRAMPPATAGKTSHATLLRIMPFPPVDKFSPPASRSTPGASACGTPSPRAAPPFSAPYVRKLRQYRTIFRQDQSLRAGAPRGLTRMNTDSNPGAGLQSGSIRLDPRQSVLNWFALFSLCPLCLCGEGSEPSTSTSMSEHVPRDATGDGNASIPSGSVSVSESGSTLESIAIPIPIPTPMRTARYFRVSTSTGGRDLG